MNSASEIPTSNLRRWILWLVVVFLTQLVLIYLLSFQEHTRVIPAPTVTPLQLLPERLTEAQFSETFLASDPSLFASVNSHGFSGPAWLKDPLRAYENINFVERTEPPYWLSVNLRQFGSSISQFVQTNSISPGNYSENIAPKIQFTQVYDHFSSSRTNSDFRVEGDLLSRELLNPPQLPSWAHTNLLSNSVVQVTVDMQGTILSTRLLERSGYFEADNNALQTARNLQFSPDGKNETTLGKLIFEWQTLPAIVPTPEVKTNQP